MHEGFPLPDVDWEPLRGFWAGAEAGALRLPRCAGCAAFNWYPRPRCRHCDGEAMDWTPLSGRGSLFSWAVVSRALFRPLADLAPYTTGLVALEEDPSVRLVTTLVDCEPEALHMDMPVHAVFRPLAFPGIPGSVRAPLFTPTRP